jgi:glutamate N-acetyltransferase/amino-acid N-acetyltransferase
MINNINISTTNCGIKYKNRDDLLLVTFPEAANAAGVFTQSSMPAAPVVFCKKNIKHGKAKALIVNAGNANAFTGKAGEDAVSFTAQTVAKNINCAENEIFISSTGVIGETLKVDLIANAIPNLVKNPITDENKWEKASKAIMTTDLKPKLVKKSCEIDGKKITLIGFSKGSGMISPNMATMLAYIFTDADIESKKLAEILKNATDKSFNSITVDSDQSTNDTLLIFATKEAKNNPNSDLKDFVKTLEELCLELAKMIVVDGEGAQKLIEIEVVSATSKQQAKTVAFAIANSPLVKTAIAGCDPNWGRIVMAVGKSCLETSPEKIIVKIGEYQLTKDGAKHPDYVEKLVHEYLKNSEVRIFVDLGIGSCDNSATVWTCDLNEEYIKINKDYRS